MYLLQESFGYLASIFLAISLLVNSSLRFRVINIAGTVSFIIYGIFLFSVPIIIANAVLLFINIFKLNQLLNSEDVLELIELDFEDSTVQRFLKFYSDDIEKYFPLFENKKVENGLCFIVLRNLVIANVFYARRQEPGTATVKINYTISQYRDYKVAKFIFDKNKNFLMRNNIYKIVYREKAGKKHERFLKKMGFVYDEDQCLSKTIR